MWKLYQWLFNVYFKKEAKCFCVILIPNKTKIIYIIIYKGIA